MKKKYFFTISIIILGILTLLKINVKSDNTIAIYIDNELKDNIPSKADNLYINKIDCDNDTTATWDNDNWGLFISNLSKKAKCNLYFIHDNEKPYWQIESVEKVNVLSTDILEFKISGTDSLGNVASNLDVSNLSFYVNDELERPIKVELTKLEELNKKITYSIKVHMVGGSGNLKVKISSGTLTDTSNNQNDEITLDTGIVVNKNPVKILHYYNDVFSSKENTIYYQILNKYYYDITYTNSYNLNEILQGNFDLVVFDYYCYGVPVIANGVFDANINIVSFGNDSSNELYLIDTSVVNKEVGISIKQINNSLTNYLPDKLNSESDEQRLIHFVNEATVLYKNTTDNSTYDSIGYIRKNDKIWFHSQLMGVSNSTTIIPIIPIIPIIQFTLGELK